MCLCAVARLARAVLELHIDKGYPISAQCLPFKAFSHFLLFRKRPRLQLKRLEHLWSTSSPLRASSVLPTGRKNAGGQQLAQLACSCFTFLPFPSPAPLPSHLPLFAADIVPVFGLREALASMHCPEQLNKRVRTPGYLPRLVLQLSFYAFLVVGLYTAALWISFSKRRGQRWMEQGP